MTAAKQKSLESKIQKLTDVLERAINCGVLAGGVPTVAEQDNNTERAAAYIGKSPATLAVWRTMTPTPGPRFGSSGTVPVYSKQDLDDCVTCSFLGRLSGDREARARLRKGLLRVPVESRHSRRRR